MANIWTNKRVLNNENSQYGPLKSKEMSTNGSRSVKKQAFSEIKNVMHNQVGATPLKGNAAKIDGLPSVFGASKSLCNEVLRKQQMRQNLADAQNKLEKKHKIATFDEIYNEPVFDESVFDTWDINRVCCMQQKSDEEIWSEMHALDINFSDFKIDSSSFNDDMKEAPIVIPELDNLPDVPYFDLLDEATAQDFDDPSPRLPNFELIDELPF